MRTDLVAVSAMSAGTYRIEQHAGTSYIVVPVVALVEGVIQGITATEPELALAEEFGKFPGSWNGRPVTIDHPYVKFQAVGDDGEQNSQVIRVSASSSPDILDDFQVGFIFNTRLKDNKLLMEAWLDPVKMNSHSPEAKELLQLIRKGEKVEISTGLFTQSEASAGTYNSREYFSVWRGVVPDHLAILPVGLTGACSIEDGCGAGGGIQTNQSSSPNSLSRESAVPSQLRVHRLVSNCGCGCNGSPSAEAPSHNFSQVAQHLALQLMPDGMMDSDAYQLLDKAVRKAHGDQPEANPYVVGFTNDHVVYSKNDKKGNRKTFRKKYSIDKKTKGVMLGEKEQAVNMTTQITPEPDDDDDDAGVTTNRSNSASSSTASSTTEKPMKITANEAREMLANFGHTPDTLKAMADDKVLELHASVEKQLASYAKKSATPANDDDEDDKDMKGNKNVGSMTDCSSQPAANAAKPAPTAQEYLAAAPAEIREALESGMRMHENHKATLIQSLLKAGARCKFNEQQLRSFDVPMLENLVELARVPTYDGVGGSGGMRQHAQEIQVNAADLAEAPPPPRLGIKQNAAA